MRALVLACIAALTAGCSLTPLEEDGLEPASNSCSGDGDCPGGVCDTSLGVCASTMGSFPNILLEVTPPTSVGSYGGIGFLKSVNDLPLAGGQLDLNIDVVTNVKGSVVPTSGNYSSCALAYGGADRNSPTAPVKVTFTPTVRLLGLSTPQYIATSEWNEETQAYEFEAWMPADTYDVYVQPYVDPDTEEDPFPDGSCTVAPQFVYTPEGMQWEVPAGDFELPLVLQPPSQLSVTVPSPISLSGWTVEIVHPDNGKLLSAPVTLAADLGGDKYVGDVEYTKLQDPALAGKELVRIRPTPCASEPPPDALTPDCGQIGPTLVVERSAVELFKEGEALVDQLSKLEAEPGAQEFPSVMLEDVSLYGDATEYQGSATVRFVSSDLDLKDPTGAQLAGVQAFFEQTVETDDGKLDPIKVLPGKYTVFVAPTSGSDFATTATEMIVAPSPSHQHGKTITLEHIAGVDGVVLTAANEPAVGATVQAVASPLLVNAIQIAEGKAFQPQALSDSVDESGAFLVEADPGVLDFSVRPADGTAFPWLVRPNVDVPTTGKALGEMHISWPVIYQGALTPAPVGSGALIRVYVYLNQDGYAESRDGATSVLQIAETRADANGAFRLFLPPHLN